MPDDPKETPTPEEPEETPVVTPAWDQSGLCPQAQADGVPCTEVGRKCEICEEAAQSADPTAW
jgi:hypothetical protein